MKSATRRTASDGPARESAAWRRTPAWIFACLSMLALVLYRGIWNNHFYKDDFLWLLIARNITESPAFLFVADPNNSEALVRMTQRLAMVMTYAAAGLQASAFHVVSMCLHIVASCLVFVFLRDLHLRVGVPSRRDATLFAAFGAVVFASSGNHSMAVLWISSQSTLLAAIATLVLSTFVARNVPRLAQRRVLTGAVGVLLLALYSKNTVVGISLVMGAYLWLVEDVGHKAELRRPAIKLAAVLCTVSAVHLLLVRVVLAPMSDSSLEAGGANGNFALSATTGLNLLGSLLAPFISAVDYAALVHGRLAYPVAAVGLVTGLLLLGHWLRVLRPVFFGLVWIVFMSAPITLLDYEQFDATQVTVTRYYYVATVGAVIVVSFLVRGCAARLPSMRWAGALVSALALLHVAHHEGAIRRSLLQLRSWGDAEMSFIELTVSKVSAGMQPGATVFAVNWKTPDVYLRSMGALYIEPLGFGFGGMADFERMLASGEWKSGKVPFVSAYDPVGRRFGVMPLPAYLRLAGIRPDDPDREPAP